MRNDKLSLETHERAREFLRIVIALSKEHRKKTVKREFQTCMTSMGISTMNSLMVNQRKKIRTHYQKRRNQKRKNANYLLRSLCWYIR